MRCLKPAGARRHAAIVAVVGVTLALAGALPVAGQAPSASPDAPGGGSVISLGAFSEVFRDDFTTTDNWGLVDTDEATIEGELTAMIEGRPRRLTAGGNMFLPRGIPHQLMNRSGDPCRYILIGTPALFDRFVEEAGRELRPGVAIGPPTPEEIERLCEASPRFGITLLPDWPPSK